MSVDPKQKHFGLKHCALLLSCLLTQQSLLARSGEEPIFFRAANITGTNALVTGPSTGARSVDATSVKASAHKVDAANIRALIASHEEAGDFYSPAIAELAEALGNALQAEGQHRAALEAYDRSFQIVRRQEGLSSASQASILRSEITSQLALGNLDASDALQQSLFFMQQQLLAEDPVALANAYLDSADWNLKYYLQARQSPVPGGRTAGQELAIADRLGDAFLQYHEALWLLSNFNAEGLNDGLDDDLYNEKVSIERKIAALTLMVNRQYKRGIPNTLTTEGLQGIQQERRANHPRLFSHGNAALQRAIEYSVATAEPVLIAESQLELADWYLLMEKHDEARATYATAAALLRDAGVPEPHIAAMLESGLPVQDPESALLALAGSEAVHDFDGYIDVAFDLNRYGKASNTRVLAGESYDESVEADLLREIRDSSFRPGFDHGAPVDNTKVTLRYYFARQAYSGEF